MGGRREREKGGGEREPIDLQLSLILFLPTMGVKKKTTPREIHSGKASPSPRGYSIKINNLAHR